MELSLSGIIVITLVMVLAFFIGIKATSFVSIIFISVPLAKFDLI